MNKLKEDNLVFSLSKTCSTTYNSFILDFFKVIRSKKFIECIVFNLKFIFLFCTIIWFVYEFLMLNDVFVCYVTQNRLTK